jgi:hypothetical protein
MLIFENQPDPITYFESLGHKFITKGEWRTTDCTFHGGSDSFRVHVSSGAFKCMSCNRNGGGVLSHYMQYHDVDSKQAGIALGMWREGKNSQVTKRPSPIPAIKLLNLLGFELQLVWNELTRIKLNRQVTEEDQERVRLAASRILWVIGDCK